MSGHSSFVDGVWGITAFFNPRRYKGRKVLYDIFREKTKLQQLRLFAVELAFGQQPFELREGDAEILLQIRAGENSVMWQKERLLNLALEKLPSDCSVFAWLDCDIIFQNMNWIEETARLLERFAVVQPFSLSARLQPDETFADLSRVSRAGYDRKPSSGYAYTYSQATPLTDYMISGHTGFVWAARRDVFDGVGLYDKMIVGGGDSALASAFFGRRTHRFTHLLPDAVVADQQQWAEVIASRVRGSVSFTPGSLFHLWHGTPQSRLTSARMRILEEQSFDPARDIALNKDGIFCWSSDKSALRKQVARYFWIRNEDGDPLRELAGQVSRGFGALRKEWTARAVFGIHHARTKLEMASSLRPRDFGAEKLSLIVMNWKRPQMVERLVAEYLQCPFIGDVVIWNNNWASTLRVAPLSRVKLIKCKVDAGLDSRWAASALADSEHLLICDDDVLLSPRALGFLFGKYLDRPKGIHGIRGRQCQDGYKTKDRLGEVDVVLTACLIVNRRYVEQYFHQIAFFDDLRGYGCGNGEDIVMNYVVQAAGGEKGMAYGIPFRDFDKLLVEHAVSRRAGHLAVRNEIVRRCIALFSGHKARFKFTDFGLDELGRLYPPVWTSYFTKTEMITQPDSFAISKDVCRQRFADSLSFLCRRKVSREEVDSGTNRVRGPDRHPQLFSQPSGGPMEVL